MPRQILETNNYGERLLKLVPAEWVSAYIAIKGILDSSSNPPSKEVYFVIIGIQFLVLPFYLKYALQIKNAAQVWITSLSFLIWVFSVGGQHFGALGWYEGYYGSVLIILWTSTIPIWRCTNTNVADSSSLAGGNADDSAG